MKTPICLLLTLCVSLCIFAAPAQAYTVTLRQVGADVVANGSGALDFTGSMYNGGNSLRGYMSPSENGATLWIGPASLTPVDVWYPAPAGPNNFGPGLGTYANSGSGDLVGIEGGNFFVPLGYVFGSPLSSSSTWTNQTFASLGVTPGTYEWTWGAGANHTYTLAIVPDSGSTFALLLVGAVGVFGVSRFRSVA